MIVIFIQIYEHNTDMYCNVTYLIDIFKSTCLIKQLQVYIKYNKKINSAL